MNIAGFVVPGYYSLDALFSASKTDDTQVCFHRTIMLPRSLRYFFRQQANMSQWLTVSILITTSLSPEDDQVIKEARD